MKTILKFFGDSKRLMEPKSMAKALSYKHNKRIKKLSEKNIHKVMQFYLNNKEKVMRLIQREYEEFKPVDHDKVFTVKLKKRRKKKEYFKDAPFPYNILKPTPKPIISEEAYQDLMKQATYLFKYQKPRKKKLKTKKLKFDLFKSIKRNIEKETPPSFYSSQREGVMKGMRSTFDSNFFKRKKDLGTRKMSSKSKSVFQSQTYRDKGDYPSYKKKYLGPRKRSLMILNKGKKAKRTFSLVQRGGVGSTRSFKGNAHRMSEDFFRILNKNGEKTDTTATKTHTNLKSSLKGINHLRLTQEDFDILGHSRDISAKKIMTSRPKEKLKISKSKTGANFYKRGKRKDKEPISKFVRNSDRGSSRILNFMPEILDEREKSQIYTGKVRRTQLKEKRERHMKLYKTSLTQEIMKRNSRVDGGKLKPIQQKVSE